MLRPPKRNQLGRSLSRGDSSIRGSDQGERDPDDYDEMAGLPGSNQNPRMFSAFGSRSFGGGEDSLSVSRLSDGKTKLLRMQSGVSIYTPSRVMSPLPVSHIRLDPTLVRELEVTRAITKVLEAVSRKVWERTLEVKVPQHVSNYMIARLPATMSYDITYGDIDDEEEELNSYQDHELPLLDPDSWVRNLAPVVYIPRPKHDSESLSSALNHRSLASLEPNSHIPSPRAPQGRHLSRGMTLMIKELKDDGKDHKDNSKVSISSIAAGARAARTLANKFKEGKLKGHKDKVNTQLLKTSKTKIMEMSQTTNWEIAHSEPIPIVNTSKPLEVMDGVEKRFRLMLAENEREKKLQQSIALEKQESKAANSNVPLYTFDYLGVRVPIQAPDQNVLVQVVAPVNSLVSRNPANKEIARPADSATNPKPPGPRGDSSSKQREPTNTGKGFFQKKQSSQQQQGQQANAQPIGTTNYQKFVKKIFKEFSSKVDRQKELVNVNGTMGQDMISLERGVKLLVGGKGFKGPTDNKDPKLTGRPTKADLAHRKIELELKNQQRARAESHEVYAKKGRFDHSYQSFGLERPNTSEGKENRSGRSIVSPKQVNEVPTGQQQMFVSGGLSELLKPLPPVAGKVEKKVRFRDNSLPNAKPNKELQAPPEDEDQNIMKIMAKQHTLDNLPKTNLTRQVVGQEFRILRARSSTPNKGRVRAPPVPKYLTNQAD